MEAELRGEILEDPIAVLGITLPLRKRLVSIIHDNPAKYIKLGQPKKFSSTSLVELKEYETS